MPLQRINVAQALANNVGPILDYDLVEHSSAIVSYYEMQALLLDKPDYVPTLRTEQRGILQIKVYRRGEGELTLQVPGGIGAAKRYPPQVEQITSEVVEFRGQDVATTKRPVWLDQAGAASPVVVEYASAFFGARSGQAVVCNQVAPGVFVLPEPGFGVMTVSYPTRHEVVELEYEPLPAVLSEAQRKTLARAIVQMAGELPEAMLPMLYVRITYAMEQPDADPVPLTVVAQERMKLRAWPIRWTMGSPPTGTDGEQQAKDGGPDAPVMELKEVSRKTRTERITSTRNPLDYVDVEVPTEIEFTDLTKRRWRLVLGV